MQKWKVVLAVAVLWCWCPVGTGQNPQVSSPSAVSTVAFSWARWGGAPPQYSIALASTGTATYQSEPRSVQRTGVPYTLEFTASKRLRTDVFQLVQKLKFLDMPSTNRRLSAEHHSVTTISFLEGKTRNQIVFLKPANALVRRLASLFQNLSSTVEFGRRLANLHKYHNARLGDELKRLNIRQKEHPIIEFQVIVPVLKEIASDVRLSSEVRKRAETLLTGVA